MSEEENKEGRIKALYRNCPDENGFLAVRTMEDKRRLMIESYGITQYKLGLSLFPPFQMMGVYMSVWLYQSEEAVLKAFNEWDPSREPEPSGWWRHPESGRRRTDGDAAREYIQW